MLSFINLLILVACVFCVNAKEQSAVYTKYNVKIGPPEIRPLSRGFRLTSSENPLPIYYTYDTIYEEQPNVTVKSFKQFPKLTNLNDQIMRKIEMITHGNIHFIENNDRPKIYFQVIQDSSNVQGYVAFKNSLDVAVVTISERVAEMNDQPLSQYDTLLHELFHALGMKHAWEPSNLNSAILPSGSWSDSIYNTVMGSSDTYIYDGRGYVLRSIMAPLDVWWMQSNYMKTRNESYTTSTFKWDNPIGTINTFINSAETIDVETDDSDFLINPEPCTECVSMIGLTEDYQNRRYGRFAVHTHITRLNLSAQSTNGIIYVNRLNEIYGSQGDNVIYFNKMFVNLTSINRIHLNGGYNIIQIEDTNIGNWQIIDFDPKNTIFLINPAISVNVLESLNKETVLQFYQVGSSITIKASTNIFEHLKLNQTIIDPYGLNQLTTFEQFVKIPPIFIDNQKYIKFPTNTDRPITPRPTNTPQVEDNRRKRIIIITIVTGFVFVNIIIFVTFVVYYFKTRTTSTQEAH